MESPTMIPPTLIAVTQPAKHKSTFFYASKVFKSQTMVSLWLCLFWLLLLWLGNRMKFITSVYVCGECWICLCDWDFCLCCVFLFVFLSITSVVAAVCCSSFWPVLMSVSDRTVVLIAASLHKCPFPPYQRGFFCNDNSIRLSYKSSTVSNTVLTAVGVTVPVVSVSSAVVLREDKGADVGTLVIHPEVGLVTAHKILPVWPTLSHHCQHFPKLPCTIMASRSISYPRVEAAAAFHPSQYCHEE